MTTAPNDKRRALGMGLDALLPSVPSASSPRPSAPDASTGAFVCPLEKIVPQRGQPRQRFDDAKLDELAQSIRTHGVIEPIVVRRVPGATEKYELIAGERRWRAAQRAGLREVLVVVRDSSPADAFEIALLENAQREDLDPVELAEALDRLVRERGYTQEDLAQRLGKDRATIANSLRLLKLPARVRKMVVEGALSEGHARALLGAADAARIEHLAEKVARSGLSVRATEQLVRDGRPAGGKGGAAPKSAKSSAIVDLESRLTRKLGARVEVRDRDGKGEIAVSYSSLDELDRLLDQLLR